MKNNNVLFWFNFFPIVFFLPSRNNLPTPIDNRFDPIQSMLNMSIKKNKRGMEI